MVNHFHAFIHHENGEMYFYWQAELDLEGQRKIIDAIQKHLLLMKIDYKKKMELRKQ